MVAEVLFFFTALLMRAVRPFRLARFRKELVRFKHNARNRVRINGFFNISAMDGRAVGSLFSMDLFVVVFVVCVCVVCVLLLCVCVCV